MKHLIAGTALLAAGFSGAACAQSSVTLYGSVDFGLGYNNNIGGHSQVQAVSGNSQPDRWGLIGTEDLGGGNKAFFRLENGFQVINGVSTRSGYMFNRSAYVGLSSDKLGTITAGHMTPFSQAWINPLDAAVVAFIYQDYHPGNIDELSDNSNTQVDNTVRYETPRFYGFKAGAQISLSNSTNFAAGRNTSFGLRYDRGPLKAAITYADETQRTTQIGSAIGFTHFQGLPLTSPLVADHLRNIAAAANYRLGDFRLHGLYTNVKITYEGRSDTFQTYEGGVTWWTSPFNFIDATAFTSTLGDVRWNQASLIDMYFLSKATQVYAGIVGQRAIGGVAVIFSNSPSSTNSQVAIRIGLHHSF
ncbi:porin [Paraburkholderia sp. ZP32-5]|uniref:porin n=1 Tax=Paraburkholderia sp. ZP32-5 TaxID=2883245 RepID=UPI001F3B0154|nr:porin [Paraburkholderia sp. ZP32-5]